MSRLTDLLQNVSRLDPELGAELTREYQSVINRQNYGLVFEKHQPEAVELPAIQPSRGSTVKLLLPRGETDMALADERLWTVIEVKKNLADGTKSYTLLERGVQNPEKREGLVADNLVVVTEFQNPVYPGLVETGRVTGVEDPHRPMHVVLNSENYHALQMLSYTHRHAIDVIYIDPPYNTRANDWKYNNDYVNSDDDYRHSKWLSMMERRLELTKDILNPENSVLIVTIDEKEYLRLGLLLEQLFPEARMQMVSSVINRKGQARGGQLARVDEYIFLLQFGSSRVTHFNIPGMVIEPENDEASGRRNNKVRWTSLIRSGTDAFRAVNPDKFYPIFINPKTGKIVSVGQVLPLHKSPDDLDASEVPEGTVAVWPYRKDGSEGRWQLQRSSLLEFLDSGTVKVSSITKTGKVTLVFLNQAKRDALSDGRIVVVGQDKFGGIEIEYAENSPRELQTKTQWNVKAHSATDHGTSLLAKFLPNRSFPYPKSLYAVEDILRLVVKDKPDATILDFFAGSGTTAHAVMRLNRQDDGRRRSISVTNNEVSADEQALLRKQGLRPGDTEWEQLGICDYITKPRITAAITGHTPAGKPIEGDYKFTDEFPIAKGFDENAVFYTLTYLSPNAVTAGRAFATIAPMLWMAAGQQGRVIESFDERGWDVTDYYGVVENMDNAHAFIEAANAAPRCRVVFIVTNDDGAFQMVAQAARDDIITFRLYESYLDNFEIIS